MDISIFGLGYVGSVTAGCLSELDHNIIGVDKAREKIDMINAGKSPVIEKGLDVLLKRGIISGRLNATINAEEAVFKTNVSLVCVGTPSKVNGSLNLDIVKNVSRVIGEAIRNKNNYHCIVFRSTVLPGTIRNILIPILNEYSGMAAHIDFDVCFFPEFLREGNSVSDFYNPPFSILGKETEKGEEIVKEIFKKINAPFNTVPYEVAEMLKYVCNCYHALKITFANEIGILSKRFGVDGRTILDLLAVDKKLNISSAYLKPGFAFGGSCLPKDLRAILHKANEVNIQLPVLSNILESNRIHLQTAIDWIVSRGKKNIGILGLSFKEGTDDLRESPVVTLVETLIGKGYQLKIYDSDVSLARIFGANKQYIEKEIPHISKLMSTDLEGVIKQAELVVVCKKEKKFGDAIALYSDHKIVYDFVNINQKKQETFENYHGICW